MGRTLKEAVQVGQEFFPVGSTPPAEVAEQITNPTVWDSEPEGKSPAKRSVSRKSEK